MKVELDKAPILERLSPVNAQRWEFRDLTPALPHHVYRCLRVRTWGPPRPVEVEPHAHSGEEFVLLLRGAHEIQLFLPDGPTEWIRLEAQDRGSNNPDYLWFPATIPHRYRNPDAGTETVALVAYYDPRAELARRRPPWIIPSTSVEDPVGASKRERKVAKNKRLAWTLGIGQRLRFLRERAGLSIENVAQASNDMTVQKLRLLEGHDRVPTLDQLSPLASAFGISLGSLLRGPAPKPIIGRTEDARKRMRSRREHGPKGGHLKSEDLARAEGRMLRPVLMTVGPRDLGDPGTWMSTHPGQELIHVIDGEIDVRVMRSPQGSDTPDYRTEYLVSHLSSSSSKDKLSDEERALLLAREAVPFSWLEERVGKASIKSMLLRPGTRWRSSQQHTTRFARSAAKQQS